MSETEYVKYRTMTFVGLHFADQEGHSLARKALSNISPWPPEAEVKILGYPLKNKKSFSIP